MLSPTILSYRLPSLILIVALVTLLPGCPATFGSQAIKQRHPAYNAAIITSINEQMLQNMVRMRYRDVTFFLEIDSVTTSLSLEANVGVDAALNFGVRDSLSPDLGLGYADNPTISYTLLEGKNRLKRLLRPIESEAILMLTQSGWDIARVFGLCFEQIEYLHDAPNSSGPPLQQLNDEEFNDLLNALSKLQRDRHIGIGRKEKGAPITLRLVADDEESKGQIREIYNLFKLNGESIKAVSDFELRTDFLGAEVRPEVEAKPLWVRIRSISSLLDYLSQHVEAPQQHQDNRLVTVTTLKTNDVSDGTDTPAGRRFSVKAKTERPDNAYIATYYRSHWFYIEDADLESKSTFMLLRELFDLQDGLDLQDGQTESRMPARTRDRRPVLTLPLR